MEPSASSIRSASFGRSLRGYDTGEVNTFLDTLADRWSERSRRLETLEAKVEQHASVIEDLEATVRSLREARDDAERRLKAQSAEVEERARALEARERDLDAREQRLKARAQEIEAQRRAAERARGAGGMTSETQQRLQTARSRADAMRQEAESLRQTLRGYATEAAEAERRLEAHQRAFAQIIGHLGEASPDRSSSAHEAEDDNVSRSSLATLFPQELPPPSTQAFKPGSDRPASSGLPDGDDEDEAWLASLFPKELSAPRTESSSDEGAPDARNDSTGGTGYLNTEHFEAIKDDVKRLDERGSSSDDADDEEGSGPSTHEMMSIWDMLDE